MGRYLIIGNGFDLAHGLKTRYTDFLYVYSYLLGNRNDVDWPFLDDRLKQIAEEFCNMNKTEELAKIVKENIWLKYFLSKIKIIGNTWIAFESEINAICEKGVEIERNNNFLYNEEYKMFLKSNPANRFNFDKMASHLDELIDLLDLYLKFVNIQDIDCCYKEILNFLPTNIINFNYTNTIERIYGIVDKIDYIHGKCSFSEKNSIVLGFHSMKDEKLDLRFSNFLKYIQMVQKDIQMDSYFELQTERRDETLFFGHSLDETDKDLIENIFAFSQKIYILYYDNKMKTQIIKNIIKIFGREKFMNFCFSRQKKLHFIKQSEPLNLNKEEIDFILHPLNDLGRDENFSKEFINYKKWKNYKLGAMPLCGLIEYLESKLGVNSKFIPIEQIKKLLSEIFLELNNLKYFDNEIAKINLSLVMQKCNWVIGKCNSLLPSKVNT